MYLLYPSAQVFMLLLEVQEAWYKDWPSIIQVLIHAGTLRAVSSGFPVKCPHLWNLVSSNFERASRGMPDAFIWIRVEFFCISDKWKEGCVSDACRNVNAVMLPVVGGILLLW